MVAEEVTWNFVVVGGGGCGGAVVVDGGGVDGVGIGWWNRQSAHESARARVMATEVG